MILAAVLLVLFGFANLAVSLLPTGPPPEFIATIVPTMKTVVASAGGMGSWIPWSVAASVAGVVFAFWLVLMAITALRWILGWIPTMGGS